MLNSRHVRFRDLAVTDPEVRRELTDTFARMLDHGMFIEGPELAGFETEFAAYTGVNHAVGVGSGTSALYLALAASGIGPGDEVITTPMSWIATLNAIHAVGATPVFVDIGADLNIDPALIEDSITEQTAAILPVHFNGRMCAMDRIMEIARRRGVKVIEDAAQVAGAALPSGRAGSFGTAGAFSLNPMKVMTGYGESGAVTTNDPEIRDRVVSMRYLGTIDKETCVRPELNHKMDALHAAFLRVSLTHLDKIVARRRDCARHYNDRLQGLVGCPDIPNDESCVFFDYTITTPSRAALMEHLLENGVEVKIKHRLLMPDNPAYAHLGKVDVPRAREMVAQILCLPIHEKLTADDIDYVCDRIEAFFDPS